MPDARLRLAVLGLRGVPHVIGGIESHCEHLYPRLASHAPELRIRILARRRYMPQALSFLGGVEVRALRSPGTGGLGTLIYSIAAILHARLVFRADIIHFHGIGPAFFVPLARAAGMRTVVTHHAPDFKRPKWGMVSRCFLRAGEKLAARFAERIVCVSEALKIEFLQRNPEATDRTVAIRHGARELTDTAIDTEANIKFLKSLDVEPGRYILAVGRFDQTKRFDDLIAAHAAARPSALPLVIVGASVDNDRYERSLREAAGRRIIFAGFRSGSELDALYRNAAMLIHPSQMEGFGLVVLEALTTGCPAASSEIPVHLEFGLPSDWYFKVGDLAAITRLIERVSPRNEPWSGAPAIVARYDDGQSLADYVRLFRAIERRIALPPIKPSKMAQ